MFKKGSMRRLSVAEWEELKANNDREEILRVLLHYVARKPGRVTSGKATTARERYERYVERQRALKGKSA